MKKKFEIDQELITKLKDIEHPSDKIDLLNDYLRNNNQIKLPVLASIYESLGDYHKQIHNPKPTLYNKASSTWEIVSTLREYKQKNKLRKIALMNAYRNSKKANLLYKKSNSKSHAKLSKENMKNIQLELHKYGGPLKQITLVIIFSMFLLSFLFIVATPTGLVTTQIESENATMIGSILAILVIIAMFFVIYKWK